MLKSSKIAFLLPYRFVPHTNGGHSAGFGFAEFLSKERDVTVISTTNNAEMPLPFRLIRLFSDRFYKYFSPIVFIKLFQFLYKNSITHLIIQQPFIGLLALPVARLLGIQLFVYSHNIEFQRFKTIGKWFWRLVFVVEWLVYKNADIVLFISQEDADEGIRAFRLSPHRCRVLPYGTRYLAPPPTRAAARTQVLEEHHLDKDTFLLLFFGMLSYEPNTQALELILYQINPILLQKANFHYKILICGGGLPARFNKLEAFKTKNIEYVGFVKDIDQYVQAADVALNPINTGGGVKTKLIEAIALGTPVVSTQTGAKGVSQESCGEQLAIVEDQDWTAFAEAIIYFQQNRNHETPDAFYDIYHWSKAVQPVLDLTKHP